MREEALEKAAGDAGLAGKVRAERDALGSQVAALESRCREFEKARERATKDTEEVGRRGFV